MEFADNKAWFEWGNSNHALFKEKKERRVKFLELFESFLSFLSILKRNNHVLKLPERY